MLNDALYMYLVLIVSYGHYTFNMYSVGAVGYNKPLAWPKLYCYK